MQEVLWLIKNIVVAVCLGAMSIQDLRQKKVSVWLIFLLGAAGILFMITDLSGITGVKIRPAAVLTESDSLWQLHLLGILPGIVVWMIGKLSGNRIGSGDGYVIMTLGICLGIWKILSCLLYGTVFCGLTGVILLVMKRKRKEDMLPFLPFLTMGYVITILL